VFSQMFGWSPSQHAILMARLGTLDSRVPLSRRFVQANISRDAGVPYRPPSVDPLKEVHGACSIHSLTG
jgi:hypothetical protein